MTAVWAKWAARLAAIVRWNEDGREPPFSPNAEVILMARSGNLPPRFRTKIEGEALGPMLEAGAVVTVSRRLVQAGAIVCVAENDRLVWRRAVCVKDGKALLRSDVAPFPMGGSRTLSVAPI